MIALAFNVPIILTCLVTRLSSTIFQVVEKSNNPNGYTVAIHTEVSFMYDGKTYQAGDQIVTDIYKQSEGVNLKKLVVLDTSGDITVECQPYE